MTDYKKHIAEMIGDILPDKENLINAVVETADESLGDFSLPCFRYAKVLHDSPVSIAEKCAKEIKADCIVEKTKAKNGYVNFFVNKKTFAEEIIREVNLSGDSYGSCSEGNGKTIVIDYSSVNIAKSLHIGHLGTTAIGGSLYKLFGFLGYNVVGINHLGDYGTQFGKMIVAYKLWGDDEKIRKDGARALQELYVRFHKEEEQDPALTDKAREWFSKIEKGDEEALRLFEFFKEITLDDVKKTYKRLNITFDSWNGESFFNDKMDAPLKLLREKGLVTESDGAFVVDLSKFGMPPCLLVKSDGSSLYATRDIAAAIYRKQTYDFDKCLYVVAYQQNLHFRQFFKVLELADFEWAKDLVHVAYGMVSLKDGAMSTRKGNTIFLEDVLNKAAEKSLAVIKEKSPDLAEKETVAEQIGTGAVIFSALENAKIKDIVFDYDRILNFDGETAPYLQYTRARCRSLLDKAADDAKISPDFSVCDDAETLRLTKIIRNFPSTVKEAAYKYEPSILSRYLINLAQAFNKYYYEHRILTDLPKFRKARLMLVSATETVLKNGLKLLGIETPDRM